MSARGLASSSDAAIVAVVLAGSTNEFAALIARHEAPLFEFLRRQSGDPELAADLTQETFLDAFRHLDRLPPDCPFPAWLFGIARNHLRRHWRRQRLRRLVSLDGMLAQFGVFHPGLTQADATSRCHERDLIQQVLDTLSPALREALLLHDAYGFTAQGVAEALGISRAAAQKRIGRAKEEFRAEYQALNRADDGDARSAD